MGEARILCATDLTQPGRRAVDLAIAAATAFGVRLDLLHIIDDADSWWPESPELDSVAQKVKESAEQQESVLREQLRAEQQRCIDAGVECEAFVARGRPWRLISENAHERKAFLLVMGAEGGSGSRSVASGEVTERVLGSTADRVVRASDRPILVAIGDQPIKPGLQGTRWFVGTDFSESSLAALGWAKRAVARVGGELHVANVVTPAGGEGKPDDERTWGQILRDESKREASKRLADYVEQHAPGAQMHQIVSTEYPSRALCDAAVAGAADMLVVGTHSQSVFGRLLLGSTAERCLRRATVPVLLIPTDAG